jgi:hypothetical protein
MKVSSWPRAARLAALLSYHLETACSINVTLFIPCTFAYSIFIHLVACFTTGPTRLPKWAFHILRTKASSFKWEFPLLSLRSSSSFLCLRTLLPFTYIPAIFPSITCCRRQFLRKMWPIQLAFRFLISCRIFLCSLTLSNTSSFLTRSVQPIFSIFLQHHISAPYKAMLQIFNTLTNKCT